MAVTKQDVDGTCADRLRPHVARLAAVAQRSAAAVGLVTGRGLSKI